MRTQLLASTLVLLLLCSQVERIAAVDCTLDSACNTATAGTACDTAAASGSRNCENCSTGTFTTGTVVTNCGTCTDQSSTSTGTYACTGCATGYYASAGTNAAPTACTTCAAVITGGHCATCTSSSACTACATGFYASAGTAGAPTTCTACPTGCSACTSATACTTAATGYFTLTATGVSGVAYACSDVYHGGNYDCATCPAAGTTIAAQSCTTITSADTGVTVGNVDSGIKVGVYLTSAGMADWCTHNTAGSITCSSNYASPQSSTYAFTTGAAATTWVASGTAGSQTFAEFSTDPWSSAGALGSATGTFQSNAYFASVNDQLIVNHDGIVQGDNTIDIDTNGISISGSTITVTCPAGTSGFYTVASAPLLCIPCSAGPNSDYNAVQCTFSTTTNTVTVTQCAAGYQVNTATPPVCVSCGTGAASCTVGAGTTPTAVVCAAGYIISTAGTSCIACGTGASSCAQTGGTPNSLVCMAGYYANSATAASVTTCTACGTGVATCAATASTIATCAAGYYYLSTGPSCALISTVFPNCATSPTASRISSYTGTPATCLTCSNGYVLNTGSTACVQCTDTNALSCVLIAQTTGYSTFSTSCAPAFTLQNGVCVACPTGADSCWSDPFSKNIPGAGSCGLGYYNIYSKTQAPYNLCTPCPTGQYNCNTKNGMAWPWPESGPLVTTTACISGYTFVPATYTGGVFTAPSCAKAGSGAGATTATNSIVLVMSYIAMISMLLVFLF